MTTISIFISSPGDVGEERAIAQQVVDELQEEFIDLKLETLLWEQEPLLASADFQSQIKTPATFDIFVTIIGSRLGSPLGDSFTREDGTPYSSGTEFEFEIALKSYRAKGNPELLVYRKSYAEDKRLALSENPKVQFQKVDDFFDKWFLNQSDKTATGAYHSFEESGQFADLFRLHLKKLLRRLLPRPNNIPKPISNFIGRDALVAEIKTKVLDGDNRFICLLGPGGSGKTRVAIRAARDLLPDFEDGVFLIRLASVRQGDMIPSAIATNLDIKQGEHTSMLDAVIESIRTKNLLLVIDNLEQISGAAHQINQLLQQCERISILATSRSDLRITGTRTIRVNPFSVPKEGRNSLRDARASDAVALFVDRARSVQGEFELTSENAAQIIDICRQLDGLPLAIELATSRMRSMNLDRLHRALAKRFSVLKGGSDELHDHQKSLKELVAWSYELLTDEEQMLWRRMAIFPAGCFTEDAEIVCDPEDDFIVDIEIEGIADKNLASIDLSGEPRLYMLQTLREFALDQLREAGEFDFYRDRFIDWALELSYQRHDELLQADDHITLSNLDLEHSNLVAAIGYCQELETQAKATTIASGVWRHWFERGYLTEARDLLMPAMDSNLDLTLKVRARALKGLGSIARFQKDVDEAEQYCAQALSFYTELDDQDGIARCLGEMGAIAIGQGKLNEGADSLDQAIEIRRTQSPHSSHESFLLATRGVVEHLTEHLEAAKSLYQQALDIGSAEGDTDSIASALVNLGEIAQAEDDYAEADRCYRESLRLFHERGKKVAVAYCTELIAGLSRVQGRPEQAALLLGFAAQLRMDIAAPIEPYNEERLSIELEKTREAITEESFDTSWDTGRDMHIDDFLTYATETLR